MVLALERPESTELANTTASASDRRRSIRIRQHRPVKVFEPATARFIGGQTDDISSTGLRLELPRWTNVRPGKLINVHVGLSHQGQSLANRRQMLPAKVVWVSREPISRTLTAGVEFLASISAHLDAA